MPKQKNVNQLFREGLKAARLGLAVSRGHYVTPAEIGAEVGVTGQTIRSYESGATEPTLDMIERLAEVMGVEPRWPPFAHVGAEREGKVVLPATAPLKPVRELEGESKRRERKA